MTTLYTINIHLLYLIKSIRTPLLFDSLVNQSKIQPPFAAMTSAVYRQVFGILQPELNNNLAKEYWSARSLIWGFMAKLEVDVPIIPQIFYVLEVQALRMRVQFLKFMSANHLFTVHALCTGTRSCQHTNKPSPNCYNNIGCIELFKMLNQPPVVKVPFT